MPYTAEAETRCYYWNKNEEVLQKPNHSFLNKVSNKHCQGLATA